MIVAGVTLIASAAFAQATSPAPRTTTGAGSTTPAKSLSKKLSHSNGVIHPKEVDPGIQQPAPKTHDSNVVPPPRDFARRSRASAKMSVALRV